MALVPFTLSSPFADKVTAPYRRVEICGVGFVLAQHWRADGSGGTALGFGATVYDSAIVISDYLARHAAVYLGSGSGVVVELGAGLGLASIALTHCCADFVHAVICTDGDDAVVRFAAANALANGVVPAPSLSCALAASSGSAAGPCPPTVALPALLCQRLLWGDSGDLDALFASASVYASVAPRRLEAGEHATGSAAPRSIAGGLPAAPVSLSFGCTACGTAPLDANDAIAAERRRRRERRARGEAAQAEAARLSRVGEAPARGASLLKPREGRDEAPPFFSTPGGEVASDDEAARRMRSSEPPPDAAAVEPSAAPPLRYECTACGRARPFSIALLLAADIVAVPYAAALPALLSTLRRLLVRCHACGGAVRATAAVAAAASDPSTNHGGCGGGGSGAPDGWSASPPALILGYQRRHASEASFFDALGAFALVTELPRECLHTDFRAPLAPPPAPQKPVLFLVTAKIA